jgi:hypothetical protein
MISNPILDELHKIRDEYAASFNYDLDAIFEDLQRRQKERDVELVSFPPQRPKNWQEPSDAVAEANP